MLVPLYLKPERLDVNTCPARSPFLIYAAMSAERHARVAAESRIVGMRLNPSSAIGECANLLGAEPLVSHHVVDLREEMAGGQDDSP